MITTVQMGLLRRRVNSVSGLSPACRVPVLRLTSQVILALSLVFNVGIHINYNHFTEGRGMVKTTNKQNVAPREKKMTTELGCVGKRARKSG